MSEEIWGPWIEHDGKGCPCRGQIVQVFYRNGESSTPFRALTKGPSFLIGHSATDRWVWLPKPTDVIRYRIRKPRGLTILEELLVNLPERVNA